MQESPTMPETVPPPPLFSVVVVACQTAPWLPAALASVEAQTFRGWEGIVYVEESTDGTLDIAREAAACDSRFRVVSAPKSGSGGVPRNYGIRHAAGRYLVFLDGDDWLAPSMLEELARKLDETGEVDILAFAAVPTTGGEVDWERGPRLSNFGPDDARSVVTGFDALRSMQRRGVRFLGYSWLNAFRTEFLRGGNLYQTPRLRLQDYEHFHRSLFAARRVAYVDKAFYAYRCRPGSATNDISPTAFLDAACQIRSLMDFVHDHPVPPDVLSFLANQWLGFLHWMLFHPATSRHHSRAAHDRAFAILAARGGLRRFRWLTRRASLPRKLAWPFFYLAAVGIPLPARLFFRCLYYPLVSLRNNRLHSGGMPPAT